MKYPQSVRVVEVGPRDGLQNESGTVSKANKIRFIDDLSASGLQSIEGGSFVSPRAVPSMADSSDVFRGIHRKPGVNYTALVPNIKGLEAAIAVKADEVAVFASASETFSQRNIQCSIAESLVRYRQVCDEAARHSLPVRGYVSCIAGCPYEGPVATEAVLRVSEELLKLGCYEVSLGDTIGVGTATQIAKLLEAVIERIPVNQLAVHFHDTFGQALANILIALQAGISVIDSSAAGLGGCPYAPGATGNVATEDVLYLLNGMNISTGVDIEKVAAAGQSICALLNRTSASKASLALSASHKR